MFVRADGLAGLTEGAALGDAEGVGVTVPKGSGEVDGDGKGIDEALGVPKGAGVGVTVP